MDTDHEWTRPSQSQGYQSDQNLGSQYVDLMFETGKIVDCSTHVE